MKLSEHRRLAAIFIVTLMLLVFGIEYGIMVLLEKYIGQLPLWGQAVLDGAILSVTVALVAYGIVFRPMMTEVLAQRAIGKRARANRDRSARALKRSEEHFRQVVTCAEVIILQWDLTGKITFLNEFGERFFGYPLSELIGRDVMDTIVPPSESLTGRDLGTMITELAQHPEEFSRNENENCCADGRRVWISWTNTPLRNDAGEATEMLSVGIDVTQRRHMEEALARAETKSRTILETLADGIVSIDANGAILGFNNAAERMFGYERTEVLGQEIGILMPENMHALHLKGITRYLESGASTVTGRAREVYGRRKSGEVFPIELSLADNVSDGEHLFIGVIRDTTERKAVEESLRKLSRAVEASPVSVMITDLDGTIEYANPKFGEVTGYTLEETVGSNPRILKSGRLDDAFYQDMWDHLTRGDQWHGNFHNIKKDGTAFWERASISPIRDEGGKITHYVAVKEDITEERRVAGQLEVAKEEAESANRAKSTFLAHMSHEIRTPLNAIMGYSQLLLRDVVDEKQHGYLETVLRSSEHLLALINDVLDMSRIESGRTVLTAVDFDVNRLLDDLDSMFKLRAVDKGLELHVGALETSNHHARADEAKIRQVLINLLGNAVKFTERGQISVVPNVQYEEDRPVELTVAVQDTGPGINSDDLSGLFDAFVQTSVGHDTQAGTGLGLAISQRLAQMMGGDLAVASVPGAGSTFTLRVRLTAAAGPIATRESPRGRAQRIADTSREFSVLVVDDVAANRQLVLEYLAALGFRLYEAENGKEALEQFEAHHPDLILMDMGMPVMDGYEATRQLKKTKAGKDTPIIAMTARVLAENRDSILAAGVDDFLAKPFHEHTLVELVGTHLDIRYLYDEAPTKPGVAATPLALSEALAALPTELRDELEVAIRSGRTNRLDKLIAQVAELDPPLAERLQALTDGFKYRYLLDQFQEKGPA